MAKITYTDKEALNEIPSIPAKNKVQAADMNEIKNAVNQNELKVLLIVDSSAPAECSSGDMYYNTTTKKIYTATGTNTWGSTGVNPTRNTLYIDYTNKSTYFYDGTDLISVGGGAGGESLKIGTIVPFAGSTIPDGYLTCDGTAISRTTYSDLFAVIGTTYGSGDGSTTFNLPNIKGRVLVGLDGSDVDFDTIGKTGGSKDLQKHNHGFARAQLFAGEQGQANYCYGASSLSTLVQSTTDNAGTGNSGNLQPYIVVNYIIKATKTTPIQAEVVNTQSNSTTDTYSCDYVNDLVQDVYSTDEVKTNKVWIDGKPIYRKVIKSNFTTSTGNTINYATSSLNLNMETLVGLRSVSQSNPKQENYFESSSDQIRSYFDNTNLTVRIGSSYPTKPCTVYTIIEYTKTTD